MARDMALLEQVSAGTSLPTLRLYGWSPPCLTLGRHQPLVAADLELCRRHGIDVVRRPTGGRAVLHHLELTYAVVTPLAQGPIPRHLQESYRLLCQPLVGACRALGVDAELTPGVNLALPGPSSSEPCFQVAAAGEVVVAGKKLIGSAMRRHHGCVLQHGAILLDWRPELQAATMGLADGQALHRSITTFAEQLGEVPPREVIEQAIIDAYSQQLVINLLPGRLSEAEQQREQQLWQPPLTEHPATTP